MVRRLAAVTEVVLCELLEPGDVLFGRLPHRLSEGEHDGTSQRVVDAGSVAARLQQP